ncbi:sensor histidine kinase [Pseudarthrobacter sp. NIBRBAC000502772]|uniref:sensor histidine kinase n=1 Tax=Pseudarthrobacter sp. NIBRBAC000502772 TaxID=2590775 RepID=UPI00113174AD|nr:sensor histidine kinase [Pseudarthrobacter sp. NIBRBAC000502772]QDG67894.1 sensor histidine kinase [Pseudarthrobacter sp. NIBRBAC000502772]
MSYMSGRTERLLPARSVWTTSMVWWHAGFYAALACVSYFALFGDERHSGTPLVIGPLVLLGAAYPFLTRTRDLRTLRPTIYVALLVAVVVFLSFVYDGAGVLLFVAFPQVWMFTSSQRQGVAATAVLCVGVAVGQISRWGLAGTEVYGITAQLVTSFVASCMIGLWISKVIEQSEQRAELLAELEATRHELNNAEQARGALAERERMAREIHDTLAQGFTSIAMLSEAAQAQLRAQPEAPSGLVRSLTAISRTARENLAEARVLVASGVPSDVQGGDLLAALKRLPDTVHLDSVRLTMELPDSLPPLPSTQQVALLRTAQEALNNVRRHSGATAAEVLMDIPAGGPPLLRLTVSDNGQGFDVSADHQGFGLKSMAARLDEIGGRLQVTSAPGATRLVAVVPTEALGPGGTDTGPVTRGTDAPLPGAVT